MNLEVISSLISVIATVVGIGFYFGKLNARLDEIEEKINEIGEEVFKEKVIKISDFHKKRL